MDEERSLCSVIITIIGRVGTLVAEKRTCVKRSAFVLQYIFS